jgi:hypothetical protein
MTFTQLFEEAPAEDTAFQALKELGKSDLGVLKQVTFLNKQYHGDDPRLTSKESQIAMSSVLSKLFYTDDRTAYFMGQMEWKPNLSVWMRFFDMIGDAPLGQFFGINSQADLPSFQGGGINPAGGDTVGDIFSADANTPGLPNPAEPQPQAQAPVAVPEVVDEIDTSEI